jgi:hypothetical protein
MELWTRMQEGMLGMFAAKGTEGAASAGEPAEEAGDPESHKD